MKKFVLASCLAATFVATPAFAAEGGLRPYVGVLVGLDHVVGGANGAHGTKDGFAYGGIVGVDGDVGANAVLGLEGEIMGATTRDSVSNVLAAGDRARIKAGRDFYIGARAGLRATPNVLAYVKAGYTNARIRLDYTSGATSFSDGTNEGGYRLGAGAEWQRGPMRLRLEYRYSDYGEVRYQGFGSGISAQRHQVLAGAAWGF